MAFWIALALLLSLAVYAGSLYLRLAAYRREARIAWTDIAVQMKRRCDLVPSLVRTLQGCAGPDRETLDAVITAHRQALATGDTPAEHARAESDLSEALARISALTAHYADMKNNETFKTLWYELTDSERRIRAAGRHYNRIVAILNAAIVRFPANLLARVFDFRKAGLFSPDGAGTTMRTA